MTGEIAVACMREARPVIWSADAELEVGVIVEYLPATSRTDADYARVLFLGDRTGKLTRLAQLTPVPVDWLRYVLEGSQVTP